MSGLSLGNDWVVGTVKLMDGRSVSSVKNVDEKVGVEKWWHKGSLEMEKFSLSFSFFAKIKKFILHLELLVT